MVRKMAYIGSSYLIGLFFASFFTYVTNFSLSVTLFTASILSLIIFKSKSIKITVCSASAAAAFLLYGLYDCSVYHSVIKYDGYDVEVKGVVTDVSFHDGDKASYTINGIINSDVKAYVTFYSDSYDVEIGDSISVLGKAKELKDSYKFPTKTYYKSKNIFIQLSKVYKLNYENNNVFSPKKTLLKYRDYVLSVINRNMDSRYSGIMTAMLFGDKTGLESADKTLMYRAGIGHIMAVSGVHLSVVCSFIWLIISRIPMNKYLRFGLLIVPVMCFVVLAGMSNSVIRAAVMVLLVYGAELFKRKADTFNSLGIAVILLTITSPFAVRDASFLLSVTGVFGIGVVAPKIIKDIRKEYSIGKIAASLISSLCVMIVVFPVIALFFDEVSVVSPVSNLILLPICEAALIGGVIVTLTGGIPFVAIPVLKFCEVCCWLVSAIAKYIGSLNFAYIPLGDESITPLITSALIIGITVSFLCKNIKITVAVITTVFVFVVSFVNIQRYMADDAVTIAVLKNNASVSAVIHDNKSACIIDLKKGGKTAEYAIKYLNREGIRKIESIFMNTDVVSSQIIYDNRFSIFDVKAYMVPENDRKLVSAEKNNMYFYTEESIFESDKYTVEFDDDIVVIDVNGTKFLFCTSESDIADYSEYEFAVLYSGRKFTSEPASESVIIMNEKPEKDFFQQALYIDESISFESDKYGKITTKLIK
ncbi:MAG: ComEC/Rec2 family competence protein [Oscillospiraceae bacterium]|nr:ComEC/Rec2 family competence protein [Oscillospiraceae bacterium]